MANAAATTNTTTPPHFLLFTYPAQGHINPALQFANRLIHHGSHVTYAIALSSRHRVPSAALDGLSFSWFSDGFDEGLKTLDDHKIYMSELKKRGSKALSEVIVTNREEGRPITCLVYSLLVPWAAEVAREFQIPSSLFWIEPATVFDIYYYYFNGYGNVFDKSPSSLIELQGLPPLATHDLPSFLQPSNIIPSALNTLREHVETLQLETNPKILVNTFETLETKALKCIEKLKMIPVGPMILSELSSSNNPFRGSNDDYTKWLDSKPERSVIYVSLGTHDMLGKQPLGALARALLDSGRPFLWVLREKPDNDNKLPDDIRELLENQGMVVPWCSQTEVLSHPSIGCFVTHCGWNSTLESLVSGVPVVAFPQFADQCTNAKLVEDVWKTGVRVGAEGGSERIRRCLEMVMDGGETVEEVRRNADKWKELAGEASAEGGPSDVNLKAFVEEIKGEASC